MNYDDVVHCLSFGVPCKLFEIWIPSVEIDTFPIAKNIPELKGERSKTSSIMGAVLFKLIITITILINA